MGLVQGQGLLVPGPRSHWLTFDWPYHPSQLHNVTLALELLKDEDLLSHLVNPEDIVNKDAKSTLRILYSLFRRHALRAEGSGARHGTPN